MVIKDNKDMKEIEKFKIYWNMYIILKSFCLFFYLMLKYDYKI